LGAPGIAPGGRCARLLGRLLIEAAHIRDLRRAPCNARRMGIDASLLSSLRARLLACIGMYSSSLCLLTMASVPIPEPSATLPGVGTWIARVVREVVREVVRGVTGRRWLEEAP